MKTFLILCVILLSGCQTIAAKHMDKACGSKSGGIWTMSNEWCEKHTVALNGNIPQVPLPDSNGAVCPRHMMCYPDRRDLDNEGKKEG